MSKRWVSQCRGCVPFGVDDEQYNNILDELSDLLYDYFHQPRVPSSACFVAKQQKTGEQT